MFISVCMRRIDRWETNMVSRAPRYNYFDTLPCMVENKDKCGKMKA